MRVRQPEGSVCTPQSGVPRWLVQPQCGEIGFVRVYPTPVPLPRANTALRPGRNCGQRCCLLPIPNRSGKSTACSNEGDGAACAKIDVYP